MTQPLSPSAAILRDAFYKAAKEYNDKAGFMHELYADDKLDIIDGHPNNEFWNTFSEQFIHDIFDKAGMSQ